ncbi:MAG TPA: alpha/beta hydrolase, partial [Polyangiaceae bacterium]
WPALLAMRAQGMHWSQQIPEKLVGLLAPRPLLVVFGEADTSVPPAFTKNLYDLAREPKELVALPKANHGEYAALGLGVYPEHLTSFFTDALNSRPGAVP